MRLLSQIKEYIALKHQATLSEVAAAIGSDKNAVEGMLGFLVRKGVIAQVNRGCGRCPTHCPSFQEMVYIWPLSSANTEAVIAMPAPTKSSRKAVT